MLDFTIEFESENFTIKAIQLRRNNFEFEWMLKYLLKYYSAQIEACHIESFPLGTLMGVMERLSQILKSNSSTHLNEYQNLIVEQSASCLCYFFQSATYAIFNSEIYLSDPTVREFFSLDFPVIFCPCIFIFFIYSYRHRVAIPDLKQGCPTSDTRKVFNVKNFS